MSETKFIHLYFSCSAYHLHIEVWKIIYTINYLLTWINSRKCSVFWKLLILIVSNICYLGHHFVDKMGTFLIYLQILELCREGKADGELIVVQKSLMTFLFNCFLRMHECSSQLFSIHANGWDSLTFNSKKRIKCILCIYQRYFSLYCFSLTFMS